ncbi:MAG: PilZ domain-containing protein [Planctomycetes bacterium]|nr:PilZ domain-containing protein [Planctomycetota bacterium]
MRHDRCLLTGLCALVLSGVLLAPSVCSAQFVDGENDLVGKLRLRKSDPTSVVRFLQYAGGAVGLAFALYYGQRLLQRRWPRSGRRRRLPAWQRTLQGYGLEAAERELIARLGAPHDLDPVRLITDRGAFERAVEYSPEVLRGDPKQERALATVRRKLGWDREGGGRSVPLPRRTASGAEVLLELNQEVEVFGLGENSGYCVRAVLVHRDDIHLVFRFLEAEEAAPFRSGENIQVYFWRPNDAGYLCQTEVRELRPKGPGFLITLVPHSVERQQKRIYVRVPYSEQLRFLHVPLESASEALGREPRSGGVFDGECDDLSAGGFRLVTDVDLRPGDYVSVPDFQAAGGEEIMARVINELSPREDGRRRFGLQYTGLPVAERDKISRLVFQLQREAIVARRRGAEPPTSTIPRRVSEPTDSDR